jgi:anti-anti-sigma factor
MTLTDIENELRNSPIPTAISAPKEGVILLMPRGQLDMQATHFIQAAFDRLVEAGHLHIILDMSSISYAASMGIGAIISLNNAITMKGGKLIMMNVHPKVLDVFSLLGFTQFLAIEDSLDNAIKVI